MNKFKNYEQNLANFNNNKPSQIVLDAHAPRESNSRLIDNPCNYLDMNLTWISIVEYACNNCNKIIENKPHPRKLDLFCFHCGISYP